MVMQQVLQQPDRLSRGGALQAIPARGIVSSPHRGFEPPPFPPHRGPDDPVAIRPLWQRAAYASLALVFFLLAVAGAILPGIPTTPFLLLTSGFLVKCSPRLNALLLRSRFLGGLLRDWQERRGVRRSVKIRALAVVALALATTVLVSRLPWLPLCGATALGLVGVLVIHKLPEIE